MSPPPFVPHLSSSSMNPGEPVCVQNVTWTYCTSSSRHTHTHVPCTTTRCPRSEPRAPRPCQGASFGRDRGPRGGQRASRAHGGPRPSVFLMALSPFIIDFNSATRHARGNKASVIQRGLDQQDVAAVQHQWLRPELFTRAADSLTGRLWSSGSGTGQF